MQSPLLPHGFVNDTTSTCDITYGNSITYINVGSTKSLELCGSVSSKKVKLISIELHPNSTVNCFVAGVYHGKVKNGQFRVEVDVRLETPEEEILVTAGTTVKLTSADGSIINCKSNTIAAVIGAEEAGNAAVKHVHPEFKNNAGKVEEWFGRLLKEHCDRVRHSAVTVHENNAEMKSSLREIIRTSKEIIATSEALLELGEKIEEDINLNERCIKNSGAQTRAIVKEINRI